MDECKVCGRKNPLEDANFCYYCGASLRDRDNGIGPAHDSDDPRTENAAPAGKRKYASRIMQWLDSGDDDIDRELDEDDIEFIDPDQEVDFDNIDLSESNLSEAERERLKQVYLEHRKKLEKTSTPTISRWKILGLMMLLLIPIYGWLFLIGWAIFHVVSSRTSIDQKELAHGLLMFFATAIVLAFLLNAYLDAHPEVMEEYNRMYQQMINGQAGILAGFRIR